MEVIRCWLLVSVLFAWQFGLFDQVTQAELHRHFHALGAGVIEDVRVQRDKGFGFVRYNTHEEAASAIQTGNGKIVCGKPVKVRILLDGFSFLCFLLPFMSTLVFSCAVLMG